VKLIQSTSYSEIEKGLDYILANESIAAWFPRVSKDKILSLYSTIEKDLFIHIAQKVIDFPDEYGSGWPDLICIREGKVSFVEVKGKDALRDSQIRIFQNILSPLSLDFSVYHVRQVDT